MGRAALAKTKEVIAVHKWDSKAVVLDTGYTPESPGSFKNPNAQAD